MTFVSPPTSQAAKFLRFGCVGGLAACIDIGGMQVLILSGADPLIARALSLPLAMLAAFHMNRSYTFGQSDRSAGSDLWRYILVSAMAAMTNYGTFAALLILIPEAWPVLCAAMSLAISMWVSFFGFQYFAFVKSPSDRLR